MLSLSELAQQTNVLLAECALYAEPQQLYDPINYILSLGGKRVRPMLSLIAAQMVGGNALDARYVAMAVECFHNFSLIHDDMMDCATLRRGLPTVHHRYDTNTALLSGDALLVHAYSLLARNPAPLLPSLLEHFNAMARGVCEGQQYDMLFETADTVTELEYVQMITQKTAVLLGASLQMGALAGGATAEVAQQLYDFGVNMGIAFQLQDDRLDTFGDEKTFGKKIGGDILQNKKTYLLIKALQCADATTQQQLHHWLHIQPNSPPQQQEKIAAVTQLYQQLGIDTIAEQQMQHYHRLAQQQLHQLPLPTPRKQALQQLCDQLLQRLH